jgi:RHS repeat-associated protein
VLWGLADHQGTIRDLVQYNARLRQTVKREHRSYDAFGNVTGETEYDAQGDPLPGTGAVDFLFAFTGRPVDADTQFYDHRARWHDPQVGRFLSEWESACKAGSPAILVNCGCAWPWQHAAEKPTHAAPQEGGGRGVRGPLRVARRTQPTPDVGANRVITVDLPMEHRDAAATPLNMPREPAAEADRILLARTSVV